MESKKKTNINLGKIIRKLLKRKKLIIRNMLLAAVVFGALIMCVPRTYTCEVTMAPEFGNAASAGEAEKAMLPMAMKSKVTRPLISVR